MCAPVPSSAPAPAPAASRSLPRIGDKAPEITAQSTHGDPGPGVRQI